MSKGLVRNVRSELQRDERRREVKRRVRLEARARHRRNFGMQIIVPTVRRRHRHARRRCPLVAHVRATKVITISPPNIAASS